MKNRDLLIVEHLKKYFPVRKWLLGRQIIQVRAVDGVRLVVEKGETFGLVGESGCGKTTLGRCILRLEEPTEGKVYLEDHDITTCDGEALRKLRSDMQMIFQDPYSSLNPRMTVGTIIGEPFEIHGILSQRAREERVRELMALVGLLPEHMNRYPHEFSGGQRQRISIARAVALNPKLIIADEPVSALDVSIQAQILNLLVQLQKQFGLTYIFISHDLSVVRHISDRVGVMYLGKIVEQGSKDSLYRRPLHPYTKALISAIPVADPLRGKKRILLKGEMPSPINPPPGCSFHPRCQDRADVCPQVMPALEEVEEGHWVACHRSQKA